MWFYDLLAAILALLLTIFVGTQVFFPAIESRKLFPIFRKRKIENEVQNVREQIEVQKLEDGIKELKDKLRKETDDDRQG